MNIDIQNHQKSARLICRIKNQCIDYIRDNKHCSEYDVTQYILREFEKRNLRTDYPPMVAFRENTSHIHYKAPKRNSKTLKNNSLIMIDLWAGLKIPKGMFADITWMYYFGKKIPKRMHDVFIFVKNARNKALKYLENTLGKHHLPTGREIHLSIKKYLDETKYSDNRNNFTGHCIGYSSPHGVGRDLNENSRKNIFLNQPYTLEPEINFPGEFGIRLELDFYIDKDYKINITTEKQEKITLIR